MTEYPISLILMKLLNMILMDRTLFPMALLCLFCLCAAKVPANTPESMEAASETTDVPHGYDGIHLQGSLMYGVGPSAVEAGVNDNSVYIQFNQNLGYVDVTIINPGGSTIYSGVVNTAVQQQLVIPITFSTEGTYTVVLENATGYADGDFEKQP